MASATCKFARELSAVTNPGGNVSFGDWYHCALTACANFDGLHRPESFEKLIVAVVFAMQST